MNKKGSNRFFAIRDMDQDVAEQSQSQIFAPDLPEPESLTPVTRLPRYPPRSDLTPKVRTYIPLLYLLCRKFTDRISY